MSVINQSTFVITDKKTFEEVYCRYYKALVGFAFTFLEDLKACEDIVQDIYYTIWKQKQDFKDEISFKVYLYRSTRNKCINYIRHQNVKNNFSREQVNMVDTEEDLMKKIMTEEVYRILYQQINRLSDKRKEVILLSIKGYSNAEIADELSISIDTVKTHKKKVYAILKGKMKEYAFLLFILLGI